MMWDVHGLQYRRDAFGFRAIDPPPAYHGWVVTVPGAPIKEIVTPLSDKPGFAVKDGAGVSDLTSLGLARLFEASWIWHPSPVSQVLPGWQRITSPDDLSAWEAGWAESSPVLGRQFPQAILDRSDVAIWGRFTHGTIDGGFIVNRSNDCLGISNVFGTDVWPAIPPAAAHTATGLPLVGYERDDDLDAAITEGWITVGPLTVWHRAT